MTALEWMFLFAFCVSSGKHKPSVETKFRKNLTKKTSRAPQNIVMLSSRTSPVYLNALYQIFNSMLTFKMLIYNMKIPFEKNQSKSVKLIKRLREMQDIMSTRSLIPQDVPSLDSVMGEGLSLNEFMKKFIDLAVQACAEAKIETEKMEKILGGKWGQKVTLPLAEGLRINPIVLHIGSTSFMDAFETYFATKTNSSLNEHNRPEIVIAPKYIFVALDWTPVDEDRIYEMLPFFKLFNYAKTSKYFYYIAHAFVYRNMKDGSYCTQVHRSNDWWQFHDEASFKVNVTNDVKTHLKYKGAILRCEMIVYNRYEEMSLENFDLNLSTRKNISIRQKLMKNQNRIVKSADESEYLSDESFSISTSSESKKRNNEFFNSDDTLTSILLNPTSYSSKNKKSFTTEMATQMEDLTEIKEPVDELFPRLYTLSVFVEDVCTQNFLMAVSVGCSQKLDLSTNQQKFILEEINEQLKASHASVAQRLLISHHVSLHARERPQMYLDMLRCVCKNVEYVFSADRRFFSLAYHNILRLNYRTLSDGDTFESRKIFDALKDDFVYCAARKKLLEDKITVPPVFQSELIASPIISNILVQMISDPLFREIRKFDFYFNELGKKDVFRSELQMALYTAREAYLQNNYHV